MNLSRTFVNATKEREDGPFAEIETLDRAHTRARIRLWRKKRGLKITTAKDYRGGSIDETETEAGANEREETPFLPSPFFPLFLSLLPRSIFSSPRIVFDRDVIPFFFFSPLWKGKKKREEERFNNGIFEE